MVLDPHCFCGIGSHEHLETTQFQYLLKQRANFIVVFDEENGFRSTLGRWSHENHLLVQVKFVFSDSRVGGPAGLQGSVLRRLRVLNLVLSVPRLGDQCALDRKGNGRIEQQRSVTHHDVDYLET